MFNDSKIDCSGLVNQKPIINYDTTDLGKNGFKLRYALNPENPIYNQVIDECKRQNILYEVMPGESKQKHIWIKKN
jgi:hypothetical protein